MISLFLKSVSFVATLGAGAIGITSPVIYIAGTSNQFEKLWRKRINYSGPVMECGQDQDTFKVYLDVDSGRGQWGNCL